MATAEPRMSLPSASWMLTAYGLGWGIAVLLSGAYVSTRYAAPVWGALALGWLVAAIGAAAGLIIKLMALGGDLTRFLFWGLLVNGGRVGFLLLVVVAAHQSGMAGFRPFVVAVFSGYFTCMVSEIAILHTTNMGGGIEHD